MVTGLWDIFVFYSKIASTLSPSFSLSFLFSLCPLFSFTLSLSDPVGPSRLDVLPDQVQATQYKSPIQGQSGSHGLHISWPRSRGQVDWYEVTLQDTKTGTRRSTRIMGTAATQSRFTALTPGTLYALSLVATAGNKTALPVLATAATGEGSSCCSSMICPVFHNYRAVHHLFMIL